MKHCWHGSDMTMMSSPPQRDYTCCHCGEVVRVRAQDRVQMAGHGSHVKLPTITVWEPPRGECPTKSDSDEQA